MEKALRVYVRIFLLVLPLFFLPVITDAYGAGKNLLLVGGGAVGLGLWLIKLIASKKAEVRVNKGLWVWLGLTILAVISYTRVTTGVQALSWFQPLGLSTLIGLLMWSWLFLQVQEKGEKVVQARFLTIGAVVMAVASLVLFLVPAAKFPITFPHNNPIISIGQAWSLSGSLVAELIMFVAMGGWWLQQLVEKYRKGNGNDYVGAAVLVAVMGLGLFISIYKIIKFSGMWLDLTTSWVIATEAFKQSPLWGVGISNFSRGFEAFRPASFNMTSLWGQGEASLSGVGILQWWTELGVVALALVLWLLAGVLKKVRAGASWWWLLVLLVVTLYLPLQLVSLFVVAWVMSVVMESEERKLVLRVGEKGANVLPAILGVVIVLAGVVATYLTAKENVADFYFWRSVMAASQNNGSATYQWQIKAIGIEPNRAEYRRLYSQTNMALAQALLSNKNISDDDKQKVSVLLQQAVREGKAAVALVGNNASYWNNLAIIYRDLIGVVDGAPDWSLQAYQQAVALDPMNPSVRLDMGGLLYAAGKYDDADRAFEQVVLAKQDYANGWYNWAYSAKQSGKLSDAVTRLNQAVSLVPATSGDYDKAAQELASWKKELDEAIAKAKASEGAAAPSPTPTKVPESLKAPQPIPTVGKEEKVNVPAADLQPPAITPVPTTTMQPSAQPTTVVTP